MHLPLIPDSKDTKWIMLKEVIKFLDSRVAHKNSQTNVPVKNGIKTLKIVLIAMLMFLLHDVSYVIKELN